MRYLKLLLLWAMFSTVAFAQQSGFAPLTNGISVPSTSYASLSGDHPAASYPGVLFYIPDGPSGATLAVSDGTSWKMFARGLVAQSYTLVTADNGSHTFAFTGLSVKPNVQYSLEDNTTTGGITSNLQSVSATGATVKVNRSLLTSLFGGTTAGITINLITVPNN